MTQDGKPTFVGSQEEIELAGRVFDLMLLQGRFYSSDHPIRQSLRELSAYFHQQGLHPDVEQVSKMLDAALSKNPRVFYREERNGDVYYITSKKGSYTPHVQLRSLGLPTITQRHISGPARPAPVVERKRPEFISRDAALSADMQAMLKVAQAAVQPPPKEAPVVKAPPKAPQKPATPKRIPQIETPQGVLINMSKTPSEILAKHREFFSAILRERLAGDDRFASFGDQWMLAENVVSLAKGELRQVRQTLETIGYPETDANLCTTVFGKDPEADPVFRFSLNYHLAGEKKVFEYAGSGKQHLWWLVGVPSTRIVRAPLKATEIGQDLRYLEDEPPVAKLPQNKWIHTLTFYEWENGLLPYSPEAKLLLPPPYLKDQKIAELRFEAPQFETSVYAELHYPTGNRGGWIEGLGEILAVFVSGARLTIARKPDAVDTFTITYQPKPLEEMTVLLYDARRQRFVFQSLPLNYEVDKAYVLDRQRFSGLKDVRRLEEANRRKGDTVIIFAFEKIGDKVEQDGKTVYRARIDDLLPVINIEKPFSKLSLLRFFTTHPHYQEDKSEAGYWFYIPD